METKALIGLIEIGFLLGKLKKTRVGILTAAVHVDDHSRVFQKDEEIMRLMARTFEVHDLIRRTGAHRTAEHDGSAGRRRTTSDSKEISDADGGDESSTYLCTVRTRPVK